MGQTSRRVPFDVALDALVFAGGAGVALVSVPLWLTTAPLTHRATVAGILAAAMASVMSRFPLVLSQRSGDAEIGFEASLLVFLSLISSSTQALALWSTSMLITCWFQRRRTRARLFNIGTTVGGGALLVSVVGVGQRLGYTGALELAMVVAGCSAYFMFDLLVTALSLALENHTPLASALRWRAVPLGLLCFVGVDTVGYLGALLYRTQAQWTLVLLLVPIATILVAANSVSKSRTAQERFSGLFAAATQAPEWANEDQIEQALVEQTERILQNADAEVRAYPAESGEIGTPLEVEGRALRHLVARRGARASAFGRDDERALEALVAVGSSSLNRRRLADEMTYLARHDVLTGLANRVVFADRLDHALELRPRIGELAVLYCDLDGFKSVNDRHGHESGDHLLIAVAERLHSCLRTADTAARLGGDEFAVLLEGLTEPRGAEALAERVLAALQPPFRVRGHEVRIRASIGIAYGTDEKRGVDLLRNADSALYRAKSLGKGRIEVFHPELRLRDLERIELEEALRKAVGEGAIDVVYQPLVELSTGRIDGFEALARWTHSTLGPVSPDTFIPMAERLGLIAALGASVLEQAHADAVTLLERCGRPFSIAVNVSAAQVPDRSLLDRVTRLVASAPSVPLVLELTEGTLLADEYDTLRALLALQATGAALAVDDFGVGYSSIGYLHRLPVAIVKIDKSFVQGLWDERACTLVQGVIAMAKAMDLEVVAEGIEDWATAATVYQMGCRLGQGFLLARPMPFAQAAQVASSGNFDVTPMLVAGPVGQIPPPRSVAPRPVPPRPVSRLA